MNFFKTRFWGLAVAADIIIVDQISKYLMLKLLIKEPIVVVPGLLDFQLAFNKGVSFSAFNDLPSSWGPYFLSGVALAASSFFIWWMGREPRMIFKIGIGLVVGGALGNVIDRLRFGAVVDFISVHYQNWYFPIFNLADSAISIGVALLLFDSILDLKRNKKADS